MKNGTKVVIDASSRIWYSSFYIEGLYMVFGKKNVSFSSEYFWMLERKKEKHSYDHYMAFVVIDENDNIKKYIIDFRDKPSVKKGAYEWCDKYAKVNFNLELTEKRFHGKIISIPPGFGIRIWGLFETIYYCISNLVKCRYTPLVSFKNYLIDYRRQYIRPVLTDLISIINKKQIISTKPYVFMSGTLWPQKNCIDGTNLLRKSFIEVCKTSECNFEGGLIASVNDNQFADYKDYIHNKRYPVDEYFNKTKSSAIVFNTPSVHNCHGWKLGEYLAMGKAIISTPISNELPCKLVHGVNIHFISSSNDLKEALVFLLKNESYRKLLEDGAKAYFINYADPKVVINNIL